MFFFFIFSMSMPRLCGKPEFSAKNHTHTHNLAYYLYSRSLRFVTEFLAFIVRRNFGRREQRDYEAISGRSNCSQKCYQTWSDISETTQVNVRRLAQTSMQLFGNIARDKGEEGDLKRVCEKLHLKYQSFNVVKKKKKNT